MRGWRLTPMRESQDYRDGVTEGQRDALVMGFPLHVGGNTYGFYRRAMARYTAVIDAEYCPWRTIHARARGYADGFDQAYLEVCRLLGHDPGDQGDAA